MTLAGWWHSVVAISPVRDTHHANQPATQAIPRTMSEQRTCVKCGKELKSAAALKQHVKDYHQRQVRVQYLARSAQRQRSSHGSMTASSTAHVAGSLINRIDSRLMAKHATALAAVFRLQQQLEQQPIALLCSCTQQQRRCRASSETLCLGTARTQTGLLHSGYWSIRKPR
jgi:hypothetical protein